MVNNTNFIDKVCVVTADIINQYTITINTSPSNISLLEIDDAYAYSKNGNQYIYNEGNSLYIFANDNGYYEFSHYTNTASVDNIVNRNYTLLVTQDMTIEAVFDAKSYQILVVAKELDGENMVDLNKEFECVYPI